MPVVRPLINLTAQGAVVSARGLVVYKRRQGRVKRYLALVDPGDSAGRVGPEKYHVLETGWIAVAERRAVQARGCKRSLPWTTLGSRG